jgi:hypothetical protein
MEFIEWWFTKHWIASTFFTPAMTLAWACYKGLVVRGIVAFLLMGAITIRVKSQ